MQTIDTDVLLSISPPARPPAFRLVRRGCVLRALPRTSPTIPHIRGDVALCDGRLVARWESVESDGSVTQCFKVLDDGADIDYSFRTDRIVLPAEGRTGSTLIQGSADIDLTHGAVRINPHREIADRIEATHPRQWYGVDLTDPRDRERARFVREFPGLAEELGVVAPLEEPRTFPLGRVRRHPETHGLEVDWAELITLHARGQFGLHGSFVDTPLAAAERFATGLMPVEVQNRAAVQSGHGPVRSRWRLDDDQQARVAPWQGRRRVACCDVLTALSPGRSETIAWVGLDLTTD